ncbi:MAG: hypothetical protein ACO1SX_07250, partial [Actinomycetota bacterium]
MLRDLMRRFAERFQHAPFRRVTAVSVGDGLLRYERGNGQTGSARWDDLDRVSIRTTDGGPWDDDVFFVLEFGDDVLYISSDAAGGEALLVELQSLPGFENAAV